MKKGNLSILKEDDTRDTFYAEYDTESDYDMGHGCDEQEPIVKRKI